MPKSEEPTPIRPLEEHIAEEPPIPPGAITLEEMLANAFEIIGENATINRVKAKRDQAHEAELMKQVLGYGTFETQPDGTLKQLDGDDLGIPGVTPPEENK